jgi:hypothetical protein
MSSPKLATPRVTIAGVHVVLETARFEALPGNRTKLSIQSVFQSVADRDGMLQSGMERGVNESYEHLNELLKTIK